MQAWLVFVHLIGVPGFLLAHGVAVGVALQLRTQRSVERVARCWSCRWPQTG